MQEWGSPRRRCFRAAMVVLCSFKSVFSSRESRRACGNTRVPLITQHRVVVVACASLPSVRVLELRLRRLPNVPLSRVFCLELDRSHVQATKSVADPWASEDPSNPSGALDEYTYVAAKANEMDTTIYKTNHESAQRAHELAEKDHRLEGALTLRTHRTSAERDKREHYKRRAARLAKSPAHARRKSQPKTRRDEKIFPDGQDSVNVAGLGAEEHLAAIHADQFHRLLRADSFDDFQDM